MSWQTPRTWVDSPTPDVFSQSLANTYVRDNLNVLRHGNDAYCKLYLTGNPSISNNLNTPISWDAAEFQQTDVTPIWAASPNPDRLVAPFTGVYLVLINLEWRSDTNN